MYYLMFDVLVILTTGAELLRESTHFGIHYSFKQNNPCGSNGTHTCLARTSIIITFAWCFQDIPDSAHIHEYFFDIMTKG